ncbi:MAG TPA: hypothetical protein DER09_15355 [Prolixibacteraceae bacterium]|nr:hypothetical protein [Prolixibacteraceae bacterium]
MISGWNNKIKLTYMNNAVTIATFTSNFDMKFFLFKEMLDEAGIKYMVVNEITSTVDGVYAGSPSNMGIEIRVLEENADAAVEIYNSIK